MDGPVHPVHLVGGTWALAALLLAAGCGTGTDGKPVAPPTTPAPAPAPPPPEAPDMPTRARVLEVGETFIVWTWDPVEDATGYEVDVAREGTPAEDRQRPVPVEEPPHRSDGLTPGTTYQMWVRAVRETAGGRAVSDWTNYIEWYTWQDSSVPLPACTDQRHRAKSYTFGHTQVVYEWQHDRPIRFRIVKEPIIAGGLRIGRPNFLEEEILEPLRDMARRLEERLGYPIMDSDAPPGRDDYTVLVEWRDRVWSPGWGAPDCPEHVGSPWNAGQEPPETILNRYLFDPAITCRGYLRDRDSETIIHELGHTFGMNHSRILQPELPPQELSMSVPLTRIIGGDSDNFLMIEDLDNLGCVFPHPDFPR